MTPRELATHYAICFFAALIVGRYLWPLGNTIACIASFLTFLAVSALQVHEAENRRRPHK